MAEDDPLNRPFDRLRAAKLLTKAATKSGCPMCARTDWIMLNQEREDTGVIVKVFDKPLRDYIRTVSVACRNCGFISQHSLPVLEQRHGAAVDAEEKSGG